MEFAYCWTCEEVMQKGTNACEELAVNNVGQLACGEEARIDLICCNTSKSTRGENENWNWNGAQQKRLGGDALRMCVLNHVLI